MSLISFLFFLFCRPRFVSFVGDLITHDTNFPRVASILAILHSNPELFVNSVSSPAIHYALKRYAFPFVRIETGLFLILGLNRTLGCLKAVVRFLAILRRS
jgi:hypothetical protein